MHKSMGQDETLMLDAPAKVALALHVKGKADDGAHQQDSLVVFGGASDQLIFKPAKHLHLSIEGPFAKALENQRDNLIVTAAQLLANELGIKPTGHLVLKKNLPITSGISGGAADAAAALLGLLRLWERTIRDEALERIASKLGSDVSLCLEGACLKVSGTSAKGQNHECFEKGPMLPKGMGLVLINPRVPIEIAPLYQSLRHSDNGEMGPMPSAFLSAKAFADWLGDQRNDLQMAAIDKVPVIEMVLQSLIDDSHCLFARLSGTGATCFGLFASQDLAKDCAQRLAFSHPNWWVSHGGIR